MTNIKPSLPECVLFLQEEIDICDAEGKQYSIDHLTECINLLHLLQNYTNEFRDDVDDN